MSTHASRKRRSKPTPIQIFPRIRNLILVALLAALLLIVWVVPFALIVLLLGFALALVLSFPVRWFSHFMSRGILLIQGAVSAVALYLIGVPYGLALGA